MPSRLTSIKLLKWVLCADTIFFVAWALAKNLRGFDFRSLHPNVGFVLAAAICIVGVTFSQIAAYRLNCYPLTAPNPLA